MEQLELTAKEWGKVRAIAKTLAPDVDRNELGKVMAYFRQHKGRSNAKKMTIVLLERLPRSGYIRSGRTKGYFNDILRACREQLADVQDDDRALLIVSWAFRLMTYEKRQKGG
ncbi:MAG: hypothetical protein ISS50_02330 [Anaerolineae bacterium]|nr:hypothetical protein [Anaerolineae bacterium]